MSEQQKALDVLKELTAKHYIQFLPRGNAAIKQALKIAKAKGKTTLLIPDQAGWITYPQFGRELKFDVKEIKTDDGYISPEMIKGDEKTILLLNAMPAYAFDIDIEAIAQTCKDQGIFFINDVSAVIGTKKATYGDIIVGSCNRWKPLPLYQGGFLAINELIEEKEVPDLDYAKLYTLLMTLPERSAKVQEKSEQLKAVLQDFSIIHPSHKGFNVIVSYKDDEEKERLIKKVHTFDATIEYTECPRYIRVNKEALSFEIKRKFDMM